MEEESSVSNMDNVEACGEAESPGIPNVGDEKVGCKVNVPILDDNAVYEVWKEDVLRWTSITSVPVSAHALTIHFALRGRAKTASDQIPRAKLHSKEGVSLLMAALDNIYLPRLEYRMYRLWCDLKKIHRGPGEKITDYITKFEQLYVKFKQVNGQLSDSNAAFWLLESCRLPEDKQDNVMVNINGCTFDNMVDKLKRLNYRELLEDKSRGAEGSADSVTLDPASVKPNEVLQVSGHGSERAQVFYSADRNSRGRFRRPVAGYRPRGYRQSRWTPSRGYNSLGRFGNSLKCNLCWATDHVRYNCPHHKEVKDLLAKKKGGVQFSMFVGCATSDKDKKMQKLLEESAGHAILDSGCATTVCGEAWLTSYVSTLSKDDQDRIEVRPSTQSFTFGDGNTVSSLRKVKIPCYLGDAPGAVTTDVVNCRIPLLLSRQSMKTIGLILDFGRDVAMVGDNKTEIRLKITSSGHYGLPISL